MLLGCTTDQLEAMRAQARRLTAVPAPVMAATPGDLTKTAAQVQDINVWRPSPLPSPILLPPPSPLPQKTLPPLPSPLPQKTWQEPAALHVQPIRKDTTVSTNQNNGHMATYAFGEQIASYVFGNGHRPTPGASQSAKRVAEAPQFSSSNKSMDPFTPDSRSLICPPRATSLFQLFERSDRQVDNETQHGHALLAAMITQIEEACRNLETLPHLGELAVKLVADARLQAARFEVCTEMHTRMCACARACVCVCSCLCARA